MKRHLTVPALIGLFAIGLLAATYQVGPGRSYTTLQAVAGLLGPGDVVEVDGDTTYAGGVVFTQPGTAAHPVTITGIRVNGRRPVLEGGANVVHFRTDDPSTGAAADHYVFQGFEIRGGTTRGIFHQAAALVLRDLEVHNCAHGILGADEGSGSLLLEYSEIHHNGSGGSVHQVYMATDEVHHPGSVFRMQHCYVHDGNGGNNVKSRAERNEIYYNWIEGAFYHELELIGPDPGGAPDGWTPELVREDSDVVGNVLIKRATSAGNDPNFAVMRLGGDGTGETYGRYRVVHNTILSGTGAIFRLFDGIESVEAHFNVFHRVGGANVERNVDATWTAAGEVFTGTSNWVTAGSTSVPTGWTGTIQGTDPGFWNATACVLLPAPGSPLLNKAGGIPASPSGHPFPSPLPTPLLMPPPHALEAPGSARIRPVSGSAPDLGAHELIRGDLDGDGICSIPDLVILKAVAAGILTPVAPPCPYAVTADVDGSGTTDAADAVMMANWLTGNLLILP